MKDRLAIAARPAFARAFSMLLGLALAAGVLVLHGVLANQVSSRSDVLSNSNASATSNHTIAFTAQNNLATQGVPNGTTASNTVR